MRYFFFFFFFNDTATTEIYTLSLHDALPIDAGGEDGLHGRRNLERLELADQAPGPAFADERLGLDEGPDDLLEEKGVAVAPLDQKLAERPQRAVVAEQRVE